MYTIVVAVEKFCAILQKHDDLKEQVRQKGKVHCEYFATEN